MNKVIFELKDGTKKEFDGEKFTDRQVATFNAGNCFSIPCFMCPFGDPHGIKVKGFSIRQVAKCYRVTEETKPIQILKRLIEGGSVWVDGEELTGNSICLEGAEAYYYLTNTDIALEKPKKKIKVEKWLNIYSDGSAVFYYSKETADRGAGTSRIACDHFVKEYEV